MTRDVIAPDLVRCAPLGSVNGDGGSSRDGVHGSDLFTIDGHVLGRFHADPHLIAVDFDDRHRDIAVDHDLLAELPAEHQHRGVLFRLVVLVVFRSALESAFNGNLFMHAACRAFDVGVNMDVKSFDDSWLGLLAEFS